MEVPTEINNEILLAAVRVRVAEPALGVGDLLGHHGHGVPYAQAL